MQDKYIHVLYKNVQQPVILAQALFRFAHAASRFNIDSQWIFLISNRQFPIANDWRSRLISIQCYSIRPLFSWDGIYIDFVVIESLIRVSVLVIVLFTDNRSKMS